MSPPAVKSSSLNMYVNSILCSSARAIHARDFPAPGSVLARMMNDIYGRTLIDSFGSLSRDTSFWKTSKGTSRSDSTASSPTYKQRVTMLLQACSRRLKRARAMKESGSSLSPYWATPRCAMRSAQHVELMDEKSETRRCAMERLENQVKYWLTPMAKGFGGNDTTPLRKMQNWPTPAARDWKGGSGPDHLTNGTGRKHMDQLPNYVTYCLHPDLASLIHGDDCLPKTIRLNPRFVEMLMGWPLGWTEIDCALPAMEFRRWSRLMHSSFWRLLTSLEETIRTERKQFLF